MDSTRSLTTNSIAFIGLASEYCAALQSAAEASRHEFVRLMLRLLPRIYIATTDLAEITIDDADCYLDESLEEDYYEAVRRAVGNLMGPDDAYLEVFEEDMKYSDTPIAASISEALADIFQVLYNFLESVRDSTDERVAQAITAVKEEFEAYWSRPLCNVLRALNQVRYHSHSIDDFDNDIDE